MNDQPEKVIPLITMQEYSFNQYNRETEFTRDNGTLHNTIAYGLLAMIGELGETIETFVLVEHETLEQPIDVKDFKALRLLSKFIELAQEIEEFKKEIRKEQFQLLLDTKPTKETIKELGGLFWYLNDCCNRSGISLEEVAKANLDLLQKRFEHNPEWMIKGEKLQ